MQDDAIVCGGVIMGKSCVCGYAVIRQDEQTLCAPIIDGSTRIYGEISGNAEPDVDALVAKILHRAEMEYKFCTAGDADPVTLQIQKACAEYKPTEEFPETFYKEVISKVILYRDTHIEFKLQNGQIV